MIRIYFAYYLMKIIAALVFSEQLKNDYGLLSEKISAHNILWVMGSLLSLQKNICAFSEVKGFRREQKSGAVATSVYAFHIFTVPSGWRTALTRVST